MRFKGLAQEPFGGCQVSLLAEPELTCVAVSVESAIKTPSLARDFDIRFINMPCTHERPLATIELFEQERSIMYGPTVDGRVVDGDAVLDHDLLEAAQAQTVS